MYMYNVFVRVELFYNESFQSSYFQDILCVLQRLFIPLKRHFSFPNFLKSFCGKLLKTIIRPLPIINDCHLKIDISF